MFRGLLKWLVFFRHGRNITPILVGSGANFVEMDGVPYASSDEFIAALRHLKPRHARVIPNRDTEYSRVADVFKAIQDAGVKIDLGFRGNCR